MTDTPRPFSIAIAALGGQGGGVLSNWLVELAESNDHIAQYTSVPGVAQRTGATIYYIETFPRDAVITAGREPVLALMPVPGDVDVVIASELMEAGRAVTRGIVTPDRTTLIASTHREFAISEKSAMGDGRAENETVLAAIGEASKRMIAFDMAAAAENAGSVISAVLFGAVAGAGVLPFPRESFEDVIRASGRMLDENLEGFAQGFAGARGETSELKSLSPEGTDGHKPVHPKIAALTERIARELPPAARATAQLGAERLVDYQDPAYAADYLDRLKPIAAVDGFEDGRDFRLTDTLAKHLALWMSYEDTIRVADLKTRADRGDRVRSEVHARDGDIIYTAEFMHPRIEEFCDTLPAGLGRWVLESKAAGAVLRPLFRSGRRIETGKLGGFLLLYALAGLRRFRRSSLRYAREMAGIDNWLARIRSEAKRDYETAIEIAKCQNLIKGYGDTHERGVHNFSRILAALDDLGDKSGRAEAVRKWRLAALADEAGEALDAALGELS